ncbi:hypothetical protein WJX72_009548 [[Myrmecia] bisecta]|uniref:R3H domain-containing protein n=1 Tax=[Myrmecia] bisecta TaxID=41462 RepID=A0AAW1P3W1_9CHLO
MATAAETDASSWENLELDKLSLAERPDRPKASATAEGSTAEASGETVESKSGADEPQTNSPPDAKPAEATASPPKIDPALHDALLSVEHRLTVLRFEQEVAAFVGNPQLSELTFMEQLPGYERLLAHRVAQYYGLETWTVIDGEHRGKISARKTASTAVPKTKLADVKPVQAPAAETAQVSRVLLKKKSVDRNGRLTPNSDNSRPNQPNGRSVQQREQEYHQARARIFGESSGGEPGRAGPTGPGEAARRPASTPRYAAAQAAGPRGTVSNGNLGKKAVFRNREEELKDPDYRRGANRFTPRFDPGFGEQPSGPQGMYMRPTYSSEFPSLATTGGHQRGQGGGPTYPGGTNSSSSGSNNSYPQQQGGPYGHGSAHQPASPYGQGNAAQQKARPQQPLGAPRRAQQAQQMYHPQQPHSRNINRSNSNSSLHSASSQRGVVQYVPKQTAASAAAGAAAVTSSAAQQPAQQ